VARANTGVTEATQLTKQPPNANLHAGGGEADLATAGLLTVYLMLVGDVAIETVDSSETSSDVVSLLLEF